MGNRASGIFETSCDFGNANGKPFDSGASRRKFLKALAVAGAGAVLSGSGLIAQVTSPSVRPHAGRVDIHHHIFPPFYVKAMEEQLRAGGFSPRPWTPCYFHRHDGQARNRHGILFAGPAIGDGFDERQERERRAAWPGSTMNMARS